MSGTCNENIDLGQEVQRITLDGQGTATINGDSSANTITVTGRGITIRGFIITGGYTGHRRHGRRVRDHRRQHDPERGINGITVFRNSSADIINNTIQNNPLAGIAIQANSSARIGWVGPPNNRVSAPNTIQNNGAQGIQVYERLLRADFHEHDPEQWQPRGHQWTETPKPRSRPAPSPATPAMAFGG